MAIPLDIYDASIAYISAQTRSSVLMKAYLWSTNNGNASGPLMDVKDLGKVRNWRVAKSQIVSFILIIILIFVKKFV